MPPPRHPYAGPPPVGYAPTAAAPLLTHEETGRESVARNRAVALAERPPPPVPRRPERRPAPPPRRTPWQRIRRVLYVLLALAILGPVLAFVIGWFVFQVPTPEQVSLAQVSRYTYADGTELAAIRPELDGEIVNRTVVRLDQVPQPVRDAVLAAENRDFYSDPGFDITGIARAVYNQLTGGVGGGSTITQQYIKVVSGEDDFSLVRKYKEVVLAVKITREQTKNEILENYLNVIYMGRGAYGIQAASQAYFGKDVGQLSVSEAAMLAGGIQAPSRLDPARNLEGSTARWNYVLDQMAAAGMITPAQRQVEVFPAFVPPEPTSRGIPTDSLGHIVTAAEQEVVDRNIATREEIASEGLTITTTINPARQREAVDAATEQLDGQPEDLRTALVSVAPGTGAVEAYYGGADGLGFNYAMAPRQPGSSFKPFVLAAALLHSGIGLGTEYDGSSPQEFPGNPRPVNNNEGFDCDECSVQTAMTRSINTVFYRMGLDVGPDRVAETAHLLGIPENLLPDPTGGISLGDKEVHPFDMASAFATLAADGLHRQPFLVAEVRAADGRVLYTATPEAGEQVVPVDVARNVTEAMIDVPEFARLGLSGGRPVAGKTGTVQQGTNGQNKDAWMVGYTPQLATAVWIGTDNSDPIRDENGSPIFGRMIPGAIWRQYMDAALRGEPVEEFSPFVPIGQAPFAEEVDENGNDVDEDQGDGNDDGDDGDDNDDGDNGGDDGGDNDDGDNGGDDGGDNGDDSNDVFDNFFPGGGDNGGGNDGGDGDGDGDGDQGRRDGGPDAQPGGPADGE